MAGIGQYLKETQAEMRHVAWPTRAQTIVYTVLVALISVGVALYLGLFDFLFTSSLARFLVAVPSAGQLPSAIEQTGSTSSAIDVSTSSPATNTAPGFQLSTTTSDQ